MPGTERLWVLAMVWAQWRLHGGGAMEGPDAFWATETESRCPRVLQPRGEKEEQALSDL